jgi:hypothetical protein
VGQYKLQCASLAPSRSLLSDPPFPADFAIEIFGSFKFFFDYARGKPNTHGPRIPVNTAQGPRKMNFAEAFGVEGTYADAQKGDIGRGNGGARNSRSRAQTSFDEEIRLAPYGQVRTSESSSPSPTDPNGRYGRAAR